MRSSHMMLTRIQLGLVAAVLALAACANRSTRTGTAAERGAATGPRSEPDRVDLPVEADGTYFPEESQEGRQLVLVRSQGALWIITDGLVAGARAERKSAGWLVHPAPPPAPDGRSEVVHLSDLFLAPPEAGTSGWTLTTTDPFTFRQWTDGFVRRAFQPRPLREFVEVNPRSLSRQRSLQYELDLLRDPRPDRLRKSVSDLDPHLFPDNDSVVAFLSDHVRADLAELSPSVPPGDRHRFERYQQAVSGAPVRPAALWPSSDDQYLMDLIESAGQLKNYITVRDGLLAKFIRGERCAFGVVIPEPTLDDAHSLVRVAAPRPGDVAFIPVRFAWLRVERPEDGPEPCEFRLDPTRSYAWQDGSFPFLLAADSSAELVGAGLIGYMNAAAFVAPGIGKRERSAVIRMQVEQIARQAE